ncbi:MAG TPA: hypothetical protein O0X19_00740 [Methanocorpusculum sp.]|nr:hypothetical protein [Methanocorpusculum sp.]HJJ32896.1 hypothetical protein [Methanocorpusculum sp.]HJJ44780.1 hypothetical protein [Methanocorpusculum sp.]HJJ58312.1 hypothetical protein [Methanocorpusculum sp.]HJJ59360.1 hypothetical protein [Methanocorpusculum sp.]
MYIIDAQVRVAQINERFELNLPEDASNYETIGGLVFSKIGRIPRLGESITTDEGVMLTVTKMRSRQILTIKMILPEQKAENTNPEKTE